MNKLTLLWNVWTAFSTERSKEGSSIRGLITASVAAVLTGAFYFVTGDMTIEQQNLISGFVGSLYLILCYFIPDKVDSNPHNLPPIELQSIPKESPNETNRLTNDSIHDDAGHGNAIHRVRVSKPTEAAISVSPDLHSAEGSTSNGGFNNR